MYADSLLKNPQSPEEVWSAATHGKAVVFRDAGNRIGLSPQEYREFLNDLLDGKAVYVRLPRRVDAMSGMHGGRVYAVRNAVIEGSEIGWRVRLHDGVDVYVPKRCANLSVLHHPVLARVPTAYVPQVYARVPETTVTFAQPADFPVAAAQAAYVPQGPPAAPFCGWWCAAPALGLFGLIHSHPTAPPCNQGSNAAGVCTK